MRQGQPDRKKSAEQYRGIFNALDDGVIIADLENGLVVEANPAAWLMHGCTRQEFIGQQLTTYVHPDSLNDLKEYTSTFPSDSSLDTRIKHVRRDGSTFYAEWRATEFNYEGWSCLLITARNINKQIAVEQTLYQQAETRTHEQNTLLEISHTLASTLELQPGLILDQLRKIIQYTHGGLFALEDASLVALATRGTPQLEHATPIRIDLQNPEILVTLFNRHQPIRIANVWSENPQAQFLRSLLDDKALELLEGMQSWMWAPLAVRGRIIGGLGIAEATKDYFTDHHADLALSVADQAAITMVNAELYGHAQALAVLEERQHLARNLHDAVNQSLFSAGLIAEVLPRLWDRDQAEARRSLEDLRRLTRGAMAEMRALLAELRPSTLTDSDLGDLLRLLGNAFSGRTNLPVAITVVEELTLPAEAQIAFYRMCQEALNNVAKHAKASQVEINLKQEETLIELCIRDNGLGFNPESTVTGGHYGLTMMRERAESAGAVLTVTSQPGHGTELTLRWVKQT